jgi:2-dehydropantoate 2-reductase
MESDQLKIVFYGAGAIGGSVAAWIAPHHTQTWLYSRADSRETLRTRGIITYPGNHLDQQEIVKIPVIDDLRQIPEVDIVIIGVKLYNLEEVAREISERIGDRAIVVGMQNGLENQKILPRYFSRVIYCIVAYNAWRDEPGVIGYQQKGPLILGTPDNSLQAELLSLAEIFNLGVKTIVTQRLQDAAHCKLVVNLSNSITTLVGLNYRPISDLGLFQRVLTNTLYEGVRVLRIAGYREIRLGGMPSWPIIWAVAHFPQRLTRRIFQNNLKKGVLSSMGQDVLQHRSTQTELEYLNGYFLTLADRYGCKVPYNRTIYRLCKQHFSQAGFEPLDIRLVWEEIQKEMG